MMMNTEPSMEILLTCLSYAPQAQPLAEALGEVNPVTWQAVLALAERHDVANLLYHRLECAGASPPGVQAEALKAAYFNSAARNMRVYHALAPILNAFEDAQIRVIVLKGAHLAQLIYPQIGLRDMSDVDLLVQQQDLFQVEELLSSLGYQSDNPNRDFWEGNHHFTYHHQTLGLMVEVHWYLFNPNKNIPIEHACVWERAVPASLAGQATHVMDMAELLPYLCAHIAGHWEFTSLRMFVDVAEVVTRHTPDIEWDLLRSNIIDWQLERPCYLVFKMSQELLGVELSDRWLEGFKPADFSDELFAMAKVHIMETVSKGDILISTPLSMLGQAIRFDQKLILTLKQFFPSRRTLSNRYPVPIDSWRIYLFYPLRWVHLIKKYSRIGWDLLLRKPQAKSQSDGTQEALRLKNWLLPETVGLDEHLFQ